LLEIGTEQNSTIVFPLPVELIGPLMQGVNGGGQAGATATPEAAIAPEPIGNGPQQVPSQREVH
jgi:hypothetical protein